MNLRTGTRYRLKAMRLVDMKRAGAFRSTDTVVAELREVRVERDRSTNEHRASFHFVLDNGEELRGWTAKAVADCVVGEA